MCVCRDLRSGEATTTARAIPGGVHVTSTWNNPIAGHMEEEFTCPEPDVLHARSTISIGGKTVSNVQVGCRGSVCVME